jgi:hypothetical protein
MGILDYTTLKISKLTHMFFSFLFLSTVRNSGSDNVLSAKHDYGHGPQEGSTRASHLVTHLVKTAYNLLQGE